MTMLCSHEGGGAWPGGVGGIVPGPLGGSLYGNGRPYGNISGAATYDAVTGTWTVTGAATVDIDSETGAAVLMCRKVIVTSTGVLTVTTNCKGLLIFASVSAEVQAGGKIHIDKLGKAGNFGDLTPYDLLPSALKYLSRGKLSRYIIKGEGAVGGPAMTSAQYPYEPGNPGYPAQTMQTGGGGTGAKINSIQGVGNGGSGGACCGGASSAGGNGTGAATPAAGPYGGPGSSATYAYTSGGNGDPVGTAPGGNGIGAGGGLLILLTPTLSVGLGAIISADGANGAGGIGTAPIGAYPSGGAGGGCLVVVTKPGGYANNGTVRANGGAATASTYNGTLSGAGGAGSVNIFQDAA